MVDIAARLHVNALRVEAFRLLRSVDLRIEPAFAVITGPNQSGKSSILEALQILADAARGALARTLVQRGGGLLAIRSRESTGDPVSFETELRISSGQRWCYRLELSPAGSYDFAVTREVLTEITPGGGVALLERTARQARLASGSTFAVPNGRETLLSQMGTAATPVLRQVQKSLASIAVYPYFRTGASWADPDDVPMRQPSRLEPGARLERTGANLSTALFTMKEERPDDWGEFLEMTRLAFPGLKRLRLPAVSRGQVQLFWDDEGGAQFDASELSDGTLAFLATLCALFRPASALIAIEEPERHLHPEALMRLVGAARSLSARQPILFTTQSDTLMGLLDDIPECVVTARQEGGKVRLVRPEVEDLREWLKSSSLRELRRELEQWGAEP